MLEDKLFQIERIEDKLLSSLEGRDVGLWIRDVPRELLRSEPFTQFIGLPWKLVLTESFDDELFQLLETEASVEDPLTRKRGFLQVVDTDPSRIELPQRCLPVYLLNGRQSASSGKDFESRLRRMTMLEVLRRSGVRYLLVVSGQGNPVPEDLKELWSSGFRTYLTFVSDNATATEAVRSWATSAETTVPANLLPSSPSVAIQDILNRYTATYPESRQVVRIRDAKGNLHKIDLTESDEPERPITEWYSLIEDRELSPLAPQELSEELFIAFFRDPTSSWKPYAAGLPWIRNPQAGLLLSRLLKKLDIGGPDESCIAYVSSESGAGGTTLARALAWDCARAGYPVLIADQVPFVPEALPLVNYLNRAHSAISKHAARNATTRAHDRDEVMRLYEAPWLIVFDSLHWQYRDGELVRFLNEFVKSGRPVCILLVTGSELGEQFSNKSLFKELAELNHAIELSSARDLGEHLNKYLHLYGKARTLTQWDHFYDDHTIRYLEGTAAFWVTLSFWIQGQYDLSESIQEWMYRSFIQNAPDRNLKSAILRIAALSTERLPLPEKLLPKSDASWPISHLLGDSISRLAALGLVRLRSDGEKHWALIHDILGRFLINALFYDFAMRSELGFATARDPEHLRFLLLRQLAHEPALGERAYRSIGEEFATSIFKIDPDHGRSNFLSIWREVVDTLNAMPKALRDTSRLFRHHTAVSRRRIAKLDDKFASVSLDEKYALLMGAIRDIKYALEHIEYTPGSESNLNLLNSLANAYFDLAEIEGVRGAAPERISEIRKHANEATRRAYEENPTNSFVIETYVKNLLQSAKGPSLQAIEQCVDALGILFSALSSNESVYRAAQLGALADKALSLLLQNTPPSIISQEPSRPIDVLVLAWKALAAGVGPGGMILSEIPENSRRDALHFLGHKAGKGNMQVIRLRYDLTCISYPTAFQIQLELVEQLHVTNYRVTPQLKLEYAILLFQNSRAVEGEKAFKNLRQLWRESEHFVEVPDRLRWLRGPDAKWLKTVHAIIGSDYGIRTMATVQEFGTSPVPFRPEEHGLNNLRPGTRFTCHVSFGHNGPFLRPVTAGDRG